jgi:ATP-binding cassette, subfamily B, bacterial
VQRTEPFDECGVGARHGIDPTGWPYATAAAALVRRAEQADSVPARRVVALFGPYRWWVAGLVALAMAQGVTGVVSPFLLRAIIDRTLPERSAVLVSWLAGGMIVASVATAALGVASTWPSNLIGQRIMPDLRVAAYGHLQKMSLRFFTGTRAGELQSRIAYDLGGVDNVITNTAASAVQNVTAAAAVAAPRWSWTGGWRRAGGELTR